MDKDPKKMNDGVVEEATPAIAPGENDAAQSAPAAGEKKNEVPRISDIIDSMNLSDSIATSAKAILEPLEKGAAPGENMVKLIVNALNHDEDVKNAEMAGYLRGRNEVIDEASKACDEREPQPVNFPIYSKRSFWD